MSSTRSVKELAECVGGVCQGDSSILIHGVADLDGAGPLEISFLLTQDTREPQGRRKQEHWS